MQPNTRPKLERTERAAEIFSALSFAFQLAGPASSCTWTFCSSLCRSARLVSGAKNKATRGRLSTRSISSQSRARRRENRVSPFAAPWPAVVVAEFKFTSAAVEWAAEAPLPSLVDDKSRAQRACAPAALRPRRGEAKVSAWTRSPASASVPPIHKPDAQHSTGRCSTARPVQRVARWGRLLAARNSTRSLATGQLQNFRLVSPPGARRGHLASARVLHLVAGAEEATDWRRRPRRASAVAPVPPIAANCAARRPIPRAQIQPT